MITLDLFESKPNKKLNENVQLGNAIKALYQKIHAQGDDAVEFMYYDSPIFAQYWDEYEGDLDSIIAEVDPQELQIILDELQSAAEDQGVAEADKHSFVGKIQRGHELKKKVDSSWKDIGDAQKAGDKAAGSKAFRKHERYANLERPGTWTKVDEQGVAEMDSQKPQGRHKADGTRSHSSYGSRDNYNLGDPETTLGPDSVLTKKDVAKKASKALDKAFTQSHKKGVAEGHDEHGFHTALEKGKFLPSKFGNKRFVYLHDLENKSPSTGGPQLVTVDDLGSAKQLADQFGGKVVKTKLGTFRIVKPAEQEVEEGIGGDMAKLIGIPVVAGAAAIGAQHYDDQQPHVEIGGQNAKIVRADSSRIPNNAMTLKGKDGKTYRVWQQSGKGMNKMTLAAPVEEVKEQQVNEISPYDYDSDEDYYNALRAAKRRAQGRSADDYDDYIDEPQDDGDDESYYEKYVRTKGLEEANKKKEAEPEVTDVGLQRDISKSRATFPTAKTGVQALMKKFQQDQDKDQQEFDKVRRADRRQDQLLAQISKVDKEQEQELQNLEKENNTLAQRLQQLQQVNNKLEKQLAAMSGRKTKSKAEKPAPVSAPASVSVSAEPKSTVKATPTASPITKRLTAPKAQSSDELDTGTHAFAQMAPQLEPQKDLFPSDYGQDTAQLAKQRIVKSLQGPDSATDVDYRMVKDPAALQKIAQKELVPAYENKEKEKIAGRYDPQDFDAMVSRVAQKAREQEKRKPVDIKDLARRLAAVKLKDEK